MDLKFQGQVDVEIGMERISPVPDRLLRIDRRAAVCIGGGGTDAGLIFFILRLIYAESKCIAAAAGGVLNVVDDAYITAMVKVGKDIEAQRRFFPFEVVTQVARIVI